MSQQKSNYTRVQVPVDDKALARLDDLAERMRLSRGRMASLLLEAGIRDEQWLIKIATMKLLDPVRNLVQSWDGGKARKSIEEIPDYDEAERSEDVAGEDKQ